MKKVSRLSKVVLAAHTGPSGGLTCVNRKQKPFEYLDLDVDFIDEDYEGSSENINKLNIDEANANIVEEKSTDQVSASEKKISVSQGTFLHVFHVYDPILLGKIKSFAFFLAHELSLSKQEHFKHCTTFLVKVYLLP